MPRHLLCQLYELGHLCVQLPLHTLNAHSNLIGILSKSLMILSFEYPSDLPVILIDLDPTHPRGFHSLYRLIDCLSSDSRDSLPLECRTYALEPI